MSEAHTVKIIFDSPATNDAFDGQGHTRTAKALAESIAQLDSETDGAIGLEGDWGAGKSSVIEMARKLLTTGDKKPKYHIFTFDLWAHQTDDFKRAFLECLLTWTKTEGLATARFVETQQKIIRNKIREVDTTNDKTYSLLGLLLIVFLPFLPLAYFWASPLAFQNHEEPFAFGQSFPALILIVLTGAAATPFGIAFIRLSWCKLLRPTWKVFVAPAVKAVRSLVPPSKNTSDHTVAGQKKDTPSTSWNEAVGDTPPWQKIVSDSWSIFSRESKHDSVKQEIRDEDPTTVEFYRVFREILSKVQAKGQRVIVVMDNIDRLPMKSVPSIWSEVRSVFAISDPKSDGESTRVIAVVPYDRTYVANAFNEKTQLQRAVAQNSGKEEEDKGAPARFAHGDIFNKTFSRILKVSPPVGSHWGGYLDQVLRQAIDSQSDDGKHQPDDLLTDRARNKIFRLLQLYMREELIHATPRMIIGFVNEFGTYWAQWRGKIPAPSIALYVLFRAEIETSPEALLSEGLIKKEFRSIAGEPDWLKHLAALAFNVDLEHAEEVLLGDRIAKGLRQNRPDGLTALKNIQGFDRIFQIHAAPEIEKIAQGDTTAFSNAALNVQALDLRGPAADEVWHAFAESIPNLGKLDSVEVASNEGLLQIVARQPPKNRLASAEAVLNVLDKFAVHEKANDGDSEHDLYGAGSHWVVHVLRLLEVLAAAEGTEAAQRFWRSIKLHHEKNFAIAVCRQLVGTNYRYADLARKPAAALVAAELVQYVDEEHLTVLQCLRELNPELQAANREPIAKAITQHLASVDVENPAPLLESLCLLNRRSPGTPGTQKAIQQSSVDGTLLHYAHGQSKSGGDENVAGDALWLLLSANGIKPISVGSPHPVFGAMATETQWYKSLFDEGETSEKVIDRIAHHLSRSRRLGFWLEMVRTDKSQCQLPRSILRAAIASDELEISGLSELFTNYSTLVTKLGPETTQQFLRRIAETQTEADIDQVVSDEQLLTYSKKLFDDVGKLEPPCSLHTLTARLDAKLKSLDKEFWLTALSEENETVDLLVLRQRASSIKMPPQTFGDAFWRVALDSMAGEGEFNLNPEDWAALQSTIHTATRKRDASRVLESIRRTDLTPGGTEAFLIYFPKLAEDLPLEEQPESAVDHFLRALISACSKTATDFIQDRGPDFKRALKSASKDSHDAIIDLVNNLNPDESEERAERVAVIRKALGFKTPKKKSSLPAGGEE